MPELPGQGVTRRHGLAALALLLGGTAVGAGWQAAAPASASGGSWRDRADAGTAIRWNELAWRAMRAEGMGDPLAAGRLLAMLHLAMHEAVNAAAPRFAGHLQVGGTKGGDPAIAAAAAAHDVLVALCPGQRAALGRELAAALPASGPSGAAAHGLAQGAAAAAAILAAREDDGAAAEARYTPIVHLGAYGAAGAPVTAPHWRRVRPFALESAAQFRVAAPPRVETAAYARDFAEVRRLGGHAATARSAAQTAIAHFWQEPPEASWNRVARLVAAELDLWEAARLFALLNMALADGRIAAWDSKLHHDSWRPETAIAFAGEDFNPATAPDPDWAPLLPAAAIPGHPSAHATLAGAAAQVLGGLLGGTRGFALASPTALPGTPPRRFAGFEAAALEAGESRILAGQAFRFAVTDGLELGERIGRHVLARQLRPLALQSA